MDRPPLRTESLRERKQRRAREAIIEAAYALFDERGFDKVTVNDIAERAEVGRATFFRYFGDKQGVVFGVDQRLDALVLTEVEPPSETPVGDSLPAALAYLRQVVEVLVARTVERPEAYLRRERLITQNPELRARGLSKHRGHVEVMVRALADVGTDRPTAVLAAEIALACFHAGREACGDDPARLVEAVDAAFARLL